MENYPGLILVSTGPFEGILIILLLLVNVKGDAPVFTRKNRTFIAFSCLGSLLLIMFSMMVGYTTMDCDHIQGISRDVTDILLLQRCFLNFMHLRCLWIITAAVKYGKL